MLSTNMIMLQIVADGLKTLKDEMVFVGGSVAELYASDPTLSDIRPTLDVDCVIEIKSRLDHSKLEDNLRKIGFVNDRSENAPICRWLFCNIKVDIMPIDEEILGFSNRWYLEGVKNKMEINLVDGTSIFIFKPEYYLAAKFEAHKNRGGNDLRQDHDFEDIIYLFDNRFDIEREVQESNATVKTYLSEECKILISNRGLTEGIETALPFGADDERVSMIKNIIVSIAEFE